MTPLDSQNFDSYLPAYEVIPEKWEDSRPVIVEQFKRHANAINAREIGFFLDQELISGKAFIPGLNQAADGGSSQQFRTILRMVVIIGPITAGTAPFPHGIFVDDNFTLIQLWACGTNSVTLTSTIFGNSDTIRIVGPNIELTSDGSYDRCFCVIEYIQEE